MLLFAFVSKVAVAAVVKAVSFEIAASNFESAAETVRLCSSSPVTVDLKFMSLPDAEESTALF